jgi:nuclear transport factor 2 (NTF2) superfamily protein
MQVLVNNNRKFEVKELMNKTLACVKDLTISKEDRKEYYSYYLSLSKEYLLLCQI